MSVSLGALNQEQNACLNLKWKQTLTEISTTNETLQIYANNANFAINTDDNNNEMQDPLNHRFAQKLKGQNLTLCTYIHTWDYRALRSRWACQHLQSFGSRRSMVAPSTAAASFHN